MKKALIVFSGYNPRAIFAFLRTLSAGSVTYGIIASSEDDTIFLSSYASKVILTRSSRDLSLDQMIEAVQCFQRALPANEYVIAPSTEALNRFFLENRQKFKELNCVVPLVEACLYREISDKLSFSKLCSASGIPVPREIHDLEKACLPVVAKPKNYMSATGLSHSPVLIMNEEDRIRFQSLGHCGDFYYQEFIGGRSFYLLYYFYKGGGVLKYSQENLVQQGGGKSIVAAVACDLHDTCTSASYEELFNSLSFRGLVMIEVRQQGDQYYMIEANPRFWGPSQLFVDAGVNFFDALLYDQGVVEILPQMSSPDPEVRYFWEGGLSVKDDYPALAFHNYSSAQLFDEIGSWRNFDIYNRSDTQSIFEREIEKCEQQKS